MDDDVQKQIVVTEPVLLVLLSLAEQPRHGYSILKDIESMSRGRNEASVQHIAVCTAGHQFLPQPHEPLDRIIFYFRSADAKLLEDFFQPAHMSFCFLQVVLESSPQVL